MAGTAGRIMKQKTPKAIEVTSERMEELLQRASDSLCDEDSELMRQIFESYAELYRIVGDRNTTIARLRKMMFGPTSEKAGNVLDEGQDASEDPEPPSSDDASDDTSSKHRTGHGRHSADDYPGAEQVHIEHPELSAGDACPDCSQGKLYEKRPGVLVRFVGQAPVQATVYRRQKLRCHLCGKVFTAPVPEGIGDSKYDHTVASMIGLLKYGSGLPFNRLERLQGSCEIPLAASTQWDIVHGAASLITPAYDELVRQAAQG